MSSDASSFSREIVRALSTVTTAQWIAGIAGVVSVYIVAKAIYNVFFHPLAKYPGPWTAKVTNAWYGYHWLTGRYPWHIQRVLHKYGDVVRIAPNELVFGTVQAYNDIHGAVSRNRELFIKSDFQELPGERHPGVSVERNVDKHWEQHKQLAPAFSARAVQKQEPIYHAHVDEFVQQVERYGADPTGINMSEWFDYISMDVAGKMAYGVDFNHVKDAKRSVIIDLFMSLGPMVLFLRVAKRYQALFPLLPFFVPTKIWSSLRASLAMNRKYLRERMERGNDEAKPDYMAMLLSKTSDTSNQDYLLSQANVMIVAGFDPLTNWFSSCLYFLTENPEKLQRLATELHDMFPTYDSINDQNLQKLKYLHGVLEEGLRLHVPAAFGLPRISPGAMVDGHYVPQGTTVQSSTFSISKDPRYFAAPHEFHPERWLPATHAFANPRFRDDDLAGFMPFGIGPRGCMGRAIGYMQGRVMLAKLIWYFHITLINGKDIDWERDNKLTAIWERPDMYMQFTPREKVGEKS